jgi:iron complex outermembrane receptor protein
VIIHQVRQAGIWFRAHFPVLLLVSFLLAPAHVRAQDDPVISISLPPLPLSEALKAVAQKTGKNILYTPDAVSHVQTPVLAGSMTALQAVTELLNGTGLVVVSDGVDGLLVEYPDADPSATVPKVQPLAIERVVVTGTSITGNQPTGINLISLPKEEMESSGATTVQSFLANSTVISGFGNAGEGSRIHNNYYQPSIHNLGASGSNATLVIIDGHQFPTGGTNHSTADPNIIPFNILQRVEIIANGDSSIYGSNAVAGVINFITRSQYGGTLINAQADYMAGATNLTAGVLSGTHWSTGNILFAYQYLNEGRLSAHDRAFSRDQDQTARAIDAGLSVQLMGGTSPNFRSFSGSGPGCSHALARLEGAGDYYDVITGQQIGTAKANAPCNLAAGTTLIESEIRNNAMLKVRQTLSGDLTIGADFLYARRQDKAPSGPRTISSVVAYATGPQANPFVRLPPGYSGTMPATQSVSADLDSILGGPATYDRDGATTMYASVNGTYDLGNDLVLDGLAVAGRDDSYDRSFGSIGNGSSVALAVNGTTNNGGNINQPTIGGMPASTPNLPLTPFNALDLWNVGSANRTSAAVMNSITDSSVLARNVASFQQLRLSVNGTLLGLSSGPLKGAAGLDVVHSTLQQKDVQDNGPGPAAVRLFNFNRTVYSAFGEIDAPLVGPQLHIPYIDAFDVNLSGRFDHYSDVGDTANYKIAFDWTIMPGLALRANMSTSFVAPGLDQIGDKYHNFISTRYGATTAMDGIPIPVAAYPILTQFSPSQFNDGKACTLQSITCVLASTVQGVNIHAGAADGHPATGRGWETGVDIAPTALKGLQVRITYWNTEYQGAFTAPSVANIINNAALNDQIVFFPGQGASPQYVNAQATGLTQTSPLPAVISAITYTNVGNYLYLYVSGIDATIRYVLATDLGTFQVSDSVTQLLKYDASLSKTGVHYNVLNTTGAFASFPSTATQSRFSLDWKLGSYSADLYANFVGPYRNWSTNTIIPITKNAQGNPSGGGDPVRANLTFDLHLGYDFRDGVLGSDSLNVTVINIADSDPPFYLGPTGYDSWVASPLGRIVKISLQTRF